MISIFLDEKILWVKFTFTEWVNGRTVGMNWIHVLLHVWAYALEECK